jgi:hypothetical protein
MAFATRQDLLDAATNQGGVLLLGPPVQIGEEFGGTLVFKQEVAEVHESTISKRYFVFYELSDLTCYWVNSPYVKQLGTEPPVE